MKRVSLWLCMMTLGSVVTVATAAAPAQAPAPGQGEPPTAALPADATPTWVVSAAMQPGLAAALDGAAWADGWQTEAVALDREEVRIVLRKGTEAQTFLLRHPSRGGLRLGDAFGVHGAAGPVRDALVMRLLPLQASWQWQPAAAQAEAQPPAGLDAELRRIDALLATHDQAAARDAVQRLLGRIELARLDARTAWSLAVVVAQLPDPTQARLLVERVVSATDPPRDPHLWPLRMAALHALGRTAEADQALQACRSQPANAQHCHHRQTAGWFKASGDWKSAALWMDRDQGDGLHAELEDLIERAAVAMRLQDVAGELRWAQMARQRFADRVEALELWASACFRARRFEEAIAAYEAVYRKDPKRPSVLAHLSGAFNRMHGARMGPEVDAAYRRLKEKMHQRARDPEDIVARFLSAVAVFYDARFAEAIPLFQQLEPRLPNEPRVQIYLAMSHYWLGHIADAQRHARRAVEQGPLDPDVYYVRSKVHQDEDRTAAIRDLERYIALAEAPGSITFADKTARIRAELAALQRGERPPDWDRPGFDDNDDRLTKWLSIGLAVCIGVAVLWRRRREAVA